MRIRKYADAFAALAVAVLLVAALARPTAAAFGYVVEFVGKIEQAGGGPDLKVVSFRMTGGSGDTYGTGVTFAPTSVGLSTFKISLGCNESLGRIVAWDVPGAAKVYSAATEYTVSTSLSGDIFNCVVIGY